MSDEQHKAADETPKPETLSVQGGDASSSSADSPYSAGNSDVLRQALAPRKRATYRPGHKATFIGLSVVAMILLANGAVVAFVMKNSADAADAKAQQGVTLSSATLSKLGVDRNPAGGDKTELTIGPATKFDNKVVVGSDLNVGGKLNLNGDFQAGGVSAGNAKFAKLAAGDTALGQLNVNGDGTLTGLNLRKDLAVAGSSRLQGAVTITNLLTVNNNVNIAGNLAIGGSLSVRDLQISNLTLGSHLTTRGAAPSVSVGGGAGSSGTASISGNDASGTVAVNAGVGAGGGVLANVSFQTKYSNTPHVVVTAVGRPVDGLYVNRTSSGFSISVSGALSPGGYAFDYIVMQ